MSVPITIRPQAEADIVGIVDGLKAESPKLAQAFVRQLQHSFTLLSDFPLMGALRSYQHPRLHGLRMVPLKQFERYVLFYLPHPHEIQVIRVLHGARDLPSLFAEDAQRIEGEN
jgi:toxin ParE1/3/4